MLRMCGFDVFDQSRQYGARIDWVRLIGRRSMFDFKGTQDGLIEGLKSVMPDMLERDVFRPWRCNMYVGVQYGQYALGIYGDGVMLEARSGAAESFYERFWSVCERCSRLDVAYDIEVQDVRLDVAELLKLEYEDDKRMLRGAGNQTGSGKMERGGGQTFELGRRDGEEYLRVYNKSAEQGWPLDAGFGCFWRCELELKRKKAQLVHLRVLHGVPFKEAATRALREYMVSKGLPADALRWDSCQPLPLRVKRHNSTERTLAWMKRNVRPAMKRMVDSGFGGDIMDALDLYDFGMIGDDQWQNAMEAWQ